MQGRIRFVARRYEDRDASGYGGIDRLFDRLAAIQVRAEPAVAHGEDLGPHGRSPVDSLDHVRVRGGSVRAAADFVETQTRAGGRALIFSARQRAAPNGRGRHMRAMRSDGVRHRRAPVGWRRPGRHVVGFHRGRNVGVGQVHAAVRHGDFDARAVARRSAGAVVDIVGVDQGAGQIVHRLVLEFRGLQADKPCVGPDRIQIRVIDRCQMKAERMFPCDWRNPKVWGHDDALRSQLVNLCLRKSVGGI